MGECFFEYNKDERGVARIHFTRKKLHNAFNDEFINSLTEKAKEIKEDRSIRLLILSGEGKSFCAGADLNWMKKMKDYTDKENYMDSVNLSNMFSELNSLPFPVIGKVQGAALGGGAGLVAICDYVLTETNTKFGFTEARLGLVPAVISPYVMAKIGESHSRAYFLSGQRFSADIALRMGLVHEVSDMENFEARLNDIIDEFLKAAPLAAREAKTLIFNVQAHRLESEESVVDYTCKTISKIRIGDEGQEGMNALLEKRKPGWMN